MAKNNENKFMPWSTIKCPECKRVKINFIGNGISVLAAYCVSCNKSFDVKVKANHKKGKIDYFLINSNTNKLFHVYSELF